MRISAGTPEEPSKKNTLEIRFPFASKLMLPEEP
jgi:hypothetical protein